MPGMPMLSPDEFAKSGKLVLQPWGKIEGEVRIGGQPAPNQQVEFQPGLFQRGGRTYVFTYGYTTLTDQQGRFAFDRVVPGPGTVSRVVTNAAASLGFPAWGWQERVEVKPEPDGPGADRRQGPARDRPGRGRRHAGSAGGLDEEPAGGDPGPARGAERFSRLALRSARTSTRTAGSASRMSRRASMCWKSP